MGFFLKRKFIFIIAILSSAIFFYLVTFSGSTNSQHSIVGDILPAFGELTVVRDQTIKNLKHPDVAQDFDEIITAQDSQAVLQLGNGNKIRLFSDTRLRILKLGESIKIILFSGEIQDDTMNEFSTQIKVSYLGRQMSLEEYENEKGRKNKVATSTASTKKKSIQNKINAPLRGLTVESIQKTMQTHRANFFRCYSQLLQKTPGVSGEAALTFTIQQTGHVAQAEVSHSTLKDNEFKRCLSETLKRVEFKSFAGDSIQALFPLRFE